MVELRRCPLCGGEAVFTHLYNNMQRVYCSECKCETARYKTDEEAIEAWNTRWKPTCQWVDHGCTECDYEDYSRFDVPERCPGCGREVVIE